MATSQTGDEPKRQMSKTWTPNIISTAEEYLNDARNSDFTIICEGKEFKVRRFFLVAQSKRFQTCCSGTFAEGSLQKVELKEDLLEAVERMIKFFYVGDYDDSVTVTSPPTISDYQPSNSLQMNAHMYAIAEKYQVPALKSLALEKLCTAARPPEGTKIDTQVMQSAIYTIWKHILLPEKDRGPKDFIFMMRVFQRPELNAQMKDFLIGSPEFTVELVNTSFFAKE